MSPALRGAAALLLAVLLLGVLLWLEREHLPEVGSALAQASPALLILAMGGQLMHLLLRALRWRLLLGPVKRGIGIGNLFSTTVVGYFVNLYPVPRLGEVVRPIMLAGREGISRSAALATVVVERVLDALSVVGLLAVYLLAFSDDLTATARSSEQFASVLVGMRVAGVALLLAIPSMFLVARHEAAIFRVLEARLQPRPGGWTRKLLDVGRGLVHGTAVVARPREALQAVLSSVAVWLTIALATWLGVVGMGLETDAGFPFRATLLLVPALAVGVSAPTPGGVGGYHIMATWALTRFFGAPVAGALATGFVLWMISIVPVAILGPFYLWRSGVRMDDIRRMTDAKDDAAAGTAGES